MRCSQCGARNSGDADWCTQCYADVRDQRDPNAPPPTGVPGSSERVPPPTHRTTDAVSGRPTVSGPVEPPDGGRRDVRERDGEVEWRCPSCEGWSPLVATACSVCGTPRRGFGEPAQPAAASGLSDAGLLGASLLLPGLGHVLAGRSGTGFARAILAVLWLLGGIALVVGNPGLRALPGWVLLVGAAVVWVATAIDVRALVSGGVQVLTTRRLGALVLAVTVGLVVAASVVLVGGR